MGVAQQVMAVIGGAIGILTALLTLYAKYLDVKKASQDRAASAALAKPGGPEDITSAPRPVEPNAPPPVVHAAGARSAAAIEGVRRTVRAPAIALMIAGGISLFCNLGLAVFGYVDEFVTPLTTETRLRQAFEAARQAEPGGEPARPGAVLDSPRATVIMTCFTLLSFSLASAIAVWAGYGMFRVKSYWLSVAGSIAVMPAACTCCFAGFPVGIWSLTVLFRPDVAAAFR